MNKENFPISTLPQKTPTQLSLNHKEPDNLLPSSTDIKKDALNRLNQRSNMPLGPRNLTDSVPNPTENDKKPPLKNRRVGQLSLRPDQFDKEDRAPKSATLVRAKRVHQSRGPKGRSIIIESECCKETPFSFTSNGQEKRNISGYAESGDEATYKQEELTSCNATACFGPGIFERAKHYEEMKNNKRIDGQQDGGDNYLLTVRGNRRGNSKSQVCIVSKAGLKMTVEENVTNQQALDNNKIMEFTLSKFPAQPIKTKESENETQVPNQESIHKNSDPKSPMEFTLSNFHPEKNNDMHEAEATANQKVDRTLKTADSKDTLKRNSVENSNKTKRMHVILRPSSREHVAPLDAQKIVEEQKKAGKKQILHLDVKKRRSDENRQEEIQSCRIENNVVKWDFEPGKPLSGAKEIKKGPYNFRNEPSISISRELNPEQQADIISLRKSESGAQVSTRMRSPKAKFLVNFVQPKIVKNEDIEPIESGRGIKQLAEENDFLRKENSQKEELIEYLLTALKQKEVPSNPPDALISSLPQIEPFLSPKDGMRQIHFNRTKLTSAERPFTPKTPSQFCQKPLIAPLRDSIETLPELERGRSHDRMQSIDETFNLLSPQLVKSSSISTQPRPPLISKVKQSKAILAVNEALSIKRVFSSPIATQFTHHSESSSIFVLPPQPIVADNLGDEAKIRVVSLGNGITPQRKMMQQSPGTVKTTLTNNAKIMLSNTPIHELIDQCEMIAKPKRGDLLANNVNTPHPRLNVPMSINDAFSPKGVFSAAFQDRPLRSVSPTQKGNKCGSVQGGKRSNILVHEEYSGENGVERMVQVKKDDLNGLKIRNCLSEATNSQGSQINLLCKEVLINQQNIRITNENKSMNLDEGGDENDDSNKRKVANKKEKFPKDVFNMNIRKKFFC